MLVVATVPWVTMNVSCCLATPSTSGPLASLMTTSAMLATGGTFAWAMLIYAGTSVSWS